MSQLKAHGRTLNAGRSRRNLFMTSLGEEAAANLPSALNTASVAPLHVPDRTEESVPGRLIQKPRSRSRELAPANPPANQTITALQPKSSESAVIAERKRIARDLHDTLAHGFTGVLMQLHAAAEALSQNSPLLAAEFVARASDVAREGLRETRRTVAALRLPELQGKSLCEALHGLITQRSDGTSLRTQILCCGERQLLPEEWEENLFHIAQEALTNTIRHARASEFKAQLFFDTHEVRLNLRDNGCGFDLAGMDDGFGLLGMRERVEAIGGHFSIQSTKGTGTSISVILQFAGAPQRRL